MVNSAKVAIVTGGSKGIGEGCATALVGAGWYVVIADIDSPAGGQLSGKLAAEGPGKGYFHPCDVRDPKRLEHLIAATVERFGRLDCLVNNAGWHPPHLPIDGFSIEDFTSLLQLNVVSCFAGCKFALPHLRKTRGSIVNISSLVATLGQEHATTYCATKGAISGFTRALAIDEARHGVRINAISPGCIDTPLLRSFVEGAKDPQGGLGDVQSIQWLGRIGTIAEAGQACLFLASDAASFITGVELTLSGGAELGYGPKIATTPA